MKLTFWVCQYINFCTIIKLINSTMHSENLRQCLARKKSYTLMKMSDNLHVNIRHMAYVVVNMNLQMTNNT